MLISCSRGMDRITHLQSFIPDALVPASLRADPVRIAGFMGWGAKASGRQAERRARDAAAQPLLFEDGFLRSFGTGSRFHPLSMVVDPAGAYYDATRRTGLERLLDSPATLISPQGAATPEDVARARTLILEHRLSKYNHALTPFEDPKAEHKGKRILVVDQTAGDLSIALGGASAATFRNMLDAARIEHPDAILYVKTHPEVSAGAKKGHLCSTVSDGRTVLIRDAVEPYSLLAAMDEVYVVTSHLGFEALLAGKTVNVFGLPWYAGWGVTEDRLVCERRQRTRSVDELFAAAYFHYSSYLNPITHQSGTIFDAIDWLIQQRNMARRFSGRMICVGFRKWKAVQLAPLLSLFPGKVRFVKNAKEATRLCFDSKDCLVVWGNAPVAAVVALAKARGVRLIRLEDGFLRSVGLGSDLIPPMSLVMDEAVLYFDPSAPSGLERMLLDAHVDETTLARARRIRERLVSHRLTKYNVDPLSRPEWETKGREVILVPGQVEDDASITAGCGSVRTNLALIQAARAAHPDAFLVYKPHPDVASGNRRGRIDPAQLRMWVDHVETGCSVIDCIEHADVIHTMTSQAGFDALLRGKKVVTHGLPFYAGWGLTQDCYTDHPAYVRRQQRTAPLTLDALVAITLLEYPIYWDPQLQGYTRCEAVIERLIEQRHGEQGARRTRLSWIERQWRKLGVLVRAGLAHNGAGKGTWA